VVLWVGVLMLANAIFHLVATIALRRYSPGVVTGTLLCLPFSLLFLRAVVRDLGIPVPAVGAMALLGGVPMYVHGYLIVFRGTVLLGREAKIPLDRSVGTDRQQGCLTRSGGREILVR